MTHVWQGISPNNHDHERYANMGGAIGAAGVEARRSVVPQRSDDTHPEASSGDSPGTIVFRVEEESDTEEEDVDGVPDT